MVHLKLRHDARETGRVRSFQRPIDRGHQQAFTTSTYIPDANKGKAGCKTQATAP